MTPEFIAIIALGFTLIGLLLTFRRDARADTQALRADNRALRAEVRAEIQNFRGQVQAEHHALRAEVHAGIERLRQDVQALTERVSRLEGRVSRLEGAIEGLFARRGAPDRHAAAARPTPVLRAERRRRCGNSCPLYRWERVGVRVFRSRHPPQAPPVVELPTPGAPLFTLSKGRGRTCLSLPKDAVRGIR